MMIKKIILFDVVPAIYTVWPYHLRYFLYDDRASAPL